MNLENLVPGGFGSFGEGLVEQDAGIVDENISAAEMLDGIAPAVLYMVSDLSGEQTGKTLGVSGPRGVREMRMMEMEGWKPPFTGWKAEDIVTHASEIFFSEEEIRKSARRT